MFTIQDDDEAKSTSEMLVGIIMAVAVGSATCKLIVVSNCKCYYVILFDKLTCSQLNYSVLIFYTLFFNVFRDGLCVT